MFSTKQWKQKGAWFTFRGHRIFYRSEGNGPALLLLHGFPTSSWDWHKVWSELCQSYRLIAPDFIGFGFSDKPVRHEYSMLDQADLVEGLLKQLSVNDYHILAHDIGDTVAQELLARQNERKTSGIRSCCLLNGGLFPETHKATATQKILLSPFGFLAARLMTFERFSKSFTILFTTATRPSNEELLSLYQLIELNKGGRIMHKLIRYILERRKYRERWLAALQEFEGPLLLIDGMDDPVSGAHMAARFRELIPHPQIVEITGCGHYPQLEAPEKVLKAYTAFRTLQP
jgi:pimeloyl-ACP methyl ester carboxylesterase